MSKRYVKFAKKEHSEFSQLTHMEVEAKMNRNWRSLSKMKTITKQYASDWEVFEEKNRPICLACEGEESTLLYARNRTPAGRGNRNDWKAWVIKKQQKSGYERFASNLRKLENQSEEPQRRRVVWYTVWLKRNMRVFIQFSLRHSIVSLKRGVSFNKQRL